MKNLLTALFLLFASLATAQIVNIPDSNFKAALIREGVDTNNDGQIQESEALAVTTLDVSNSEPGFFVQQINDLTGILSFANLKTLDCSNNEIKILDIANHANIESINIKNYDYLGSAPNPAPVFNAGNCPRLKTFNMSLNFNPHYTPTVHLSNCDSLTNLGVANSAILTLDISGSKKIQNIIGFRWINNLIASNCTSLTIIETGNFGGGCSLLDVANCINLETVFFGEANPIDTIDLSTCPNIKRVFFAYLDSYRPYINIKNGTRMIDLTIGLAPGINGLPPLVNICADDFEIDSAASWLHFVNTPAYPLVEMNPYCSFTPAGSYNKITGQVKIDGNNNGCDSADRSMSQLPIVVSDQLGNSFIKYTEAAGNYEHYFYTGQFTLTPHFPYPYFSVNPAVAAVSFDTANSLIATRDFCIQPNGIHNDLEISFLPTFPPARPGFDANYTLVYKNRGTTTLSGNVTVNFDNSKMNFVSASENVTTQSTGQLTWNYNNLQPFESKTITVTFNLLPPPVNNIGDTIIYLAAITPSANDETAFDNSFILPQRLIASYDPNDKQCIEGSKLDISKIGDYLHYQIRFQNEGTDTAFNIVIADTLSNNLDWNSFEFIGSSHTADVKLTSNKLEFFFQDIHLPYKTIDEPGSNGWVAFKIKPKPSVVIGDSINNKAAIYFDFNLPVITNTATTIVTNSSGPVPVKLEYFSANKKDNSNQLNWKASCTYGNATFIIERSNDGIHFAGIGNINATSLRCQLPFNFIDNNPVAGKNYYRLKITDAEGISFYSKVLVVGNNKAGVEITAVANNVVYLNSNKQQPITMKVIASDGREVMSLKQTINAGNNNINLQMKNAANGMYTLIFYSGDGDVITRKFMR